MVRVGLAVGGAALVLAGAAALTWSQADYEEIRTVPLEGIGSVQLAGGAGGIEVRYEPGARGEVREKVHRAALWGGGADAGHRVEGDRLVLGTSCGWNCGVDYSVTLPTPVPVRGELGSGSLDVDGMASVDARVASGGVHVRRVDGPVLVDSRSGEVVLADLGGDVEVRGRSGGVDARELRGERFVADVASGSVSARLTAPRTVDVSSGSGGIDLAVPRGAYRVDSDTGSGGEEIGVQRDPNSQQSIRVSTRSGSIEVKPL
ncbi:DUF4097 family beta strand repeat-containing protein [Saccharopolyspora taberi]|uniref:Adhesin domain-containing protein n=1 Tax=Saccharopolyspora taberi TaxID=60895 RepID=A0ABN3VLL8_9PSEU